MEEDWTESKATAERDVMIRQAWFARQIMICGYFLMVLAFIAIIVLPCFGLSFRRFTNLTDRGRPLPLQTYYFYDTDSSPLYEVTFVAQGVAIFLSAVTYTSVDAFLGLAILHMCGQLENFRQRLSGLAACQDFRRVLRDSVTSHLRLIRFVRK